MIDLKHDDFQKSEKISDIFQQPSDDEIFRIELTEHARSLASGTISTNPVAAK